MEKVIYHGGNNDKCDERMIVVQKMVGSVLCNDYYNSTGNHITDGICQKCREPLFDEDGNFIEANYP